MTGKSLALILALCAAIAGGAMYYLQVYGFYYPVDDAPEQGVTLALRDSDTATTIDFEDFEAIDADSSPIRYRACFTTAADPVELAQTHVTLTDMVPRNAPGWFDCFDAAALTREIEAGTATVFLGTKNIAYGVDRVIAITDQGRGYIWHDLNNCGNKTYDGTVIGEECPPRPDTQRTN
ncbi:DUF6446 family protein [Pontibaca salina]|uniref:DUF6446 family protein n=1 Tax=Pontibaca salina TaxID=2795731 RepID=UPI002FCD7548